MMQCLNIVALVYQTHFMELSNAEMNTSQIANSLYKKNLKEEKKNDRREAIAVGFEPTTFRSGV